MFNAFVSHRLTNSAQQLRVLIAQARIPLQVNSEGHARSADGPDVQVMNALHTRHRLQISQNGSRVNPVGHLIHQFGQTIAQQHDSEPTHADADSQASEGVNPCPTGDPGQQGAQRDRSSDGRIPEQMQNSSSSVQIIVVIGTEQPR